MATEKQISITAVCRQLGYSKQAYYKSLRTIKLKSSGSAIAKQNVLSLRKQMPRLGTRKLYHLLKSGFKKEQISMGRDKLFDLLRKEGLLIIKKKRYTKTTNSKHWLRKYPDLLKQTTLTHPEQVWVADITYVAIDNGFSYLHLITDAYSKQIMGYCVSNNLAAAATGKALQMAISKRKYRTSLVHHSDRGLQYCSAGYVKILECNHIQISMTQDGNPYDNAVAERLNGILKDEFGLDDVLADLQQVQKQTEQAISLYNNHRPHLSCSMLTPQQMHSQTKLAIKTWSKKRSQKLLSSCDLLPSLQHL